MLAGEWEVARNSWEIPPLNLRRASLLLLLGSTYTILDKAAFGLFPALNDSRPAVMAMSILDLGAKFTLLLFAWRFLVELRPRHRLLRGSLVSIILLPGVLIFSQLLMLGSTAAGAGPRLLFRAVVLLDSVAVLLFAMSLARLVAGDSPLRAPLRVLKWALVINVALRLVSTGYYGLYLATGREAEPLPSLRPLALLVFLGTYGVALWFLFRFWRLGTYQDLVRE